jgi:hypothetical protein
MASNSTNATTKEAKVVVKHYTNAEEDFLVFYPFSSATLNDIYYGGGSTAQNSATGHYFAASANNTTTSGTIVASITSTGLAVTGALSASGLISRSDTTTGTAFYAGMAVSANAYRDIRLASAQSGSSYGAAVRGGLNGSGSPYGALMHYTASTETQVATWNDAGLAVTGTISSTGALTVNSTAASPIGLTLIGDNNSYNPRMVFKTGTGSSAGKLDWLDASSVLQARFSYNDSIGGAFEWKPGGSTNAMSLTSSGLAVTGTLSSTTGATFATSSGNVGIGTASGVTNGGFSFEPNYNGTGISAAFFGHSSAGASSHQYCVFAYNGTSIGSITQNGTTAVLYNVTSDYRRKSNVKDLTGSGAFIDALKPRTFDWDTGDKGVGFIAHEFAEVSPLSVSGEKDSVDADGKPVYQSMPNPMTSLDKLQQLYAASRIAALNADQHDALRKWAQELAEELKPKDKPDGEERTE